MKMAIASTMEIEVNPTRVVKECEFRRLILGAHFGSIVGIFPSDRVLLRHGWKAC